MFKLTTGTVYYSLCIVFVGALCCCVAVILSYLLSTIALESVSCNRWVFKLTTGTVYYSLCIVFVGGNILERDGFD